MKLLALRVQHFRRFAEPVAVEGIGDGVNVLAGPNEMGKSTLFQALEAAFLLRHRVTGAVLDGMRPRAGGEPLVEVDFIAGGAAWRLRKQFGRGAGAVLTHADSGRIEARAGDAEDRVAALIGRKDESLGRFGLVWVKQQRSLVAADPDIDPTSGKEKVRGERQALVDIIGHEIETAAGGDTFNAVHILVEAARDTLLTPARSGVKKNGPLDLARRGRDALKIQLAEAQQAAQLAQTRLARIAELSADLARVQREQRRAVGENMIAVLEGRIAEAVAVRAKYDVARQALKTAESEAVAARQAQQAHADATQRRAQLTDAKAAAVALEALIADLAAAINADPATPARLDQLLKLDHALALAEATLASEAASVEIALQAGHGNRVRTGGSVVDTDLRITVTEALQIDIDGIAGIRVSAGGGSRAKAAAVRKEAAAGEIAALFKEMGITSLDDTRTRAAARAACVDRLDEARVKLSVLAPRGSGQIAAELAKLEIIAAGVGNLADAVRDTQEALAGARAGLHGLEAQAVSDATFKSFGVQLQRLKDEEAQRASDVTRLTLAIEKLKSEQDGADEDGRAARVDGLSGELQRADAEVRRLEAEVSALNLLSSTLDRIEAAARQQYFEPVSRHLTPHLQTVFGVARAGFGDTFAPSTLVREGGEETIATLSDGTREQLSVLVRLSFAELLAANGHAAPLILDDPLVYSDDERLARMCAAISGAGRNVQVLLLTCRAAAFEQLPGRRLAVSAWRPD
jgi:DNA repair exonuclease SbcCD ATPase subunit